MAKVKMTWKHYTKPYTYWVGWTGKVNMFSITQGLDRKTQEPDFELECPEFGAEEDRPDAVFATVKEAKAAAQTFIQGYVDNLLCQDWADDPAMHTEVINGR